MSRAELTQQTADRTGTAAGPVFSHVPEDTPRVPEDAPQQSDAGSPAVCGEAAGTIPDSTDAGSTDTAGAGLELLDPRIAGWVHSLGWQDLRPVQKAALGPVLSGETDVILSAATASGKTEAAFLPALSRVLTSHVPGTGLLYISPLKALINDQYRRLEPLCARVDLSIIPWHGDLAAQARYRYLDTATGILLTTPESLEGFLLRHYAFCCRAFSGLSHIIIDEFHSFAGTERGRQLISLLHRIETLAHRKIPRIALSATFGDAADMQHELRPHRDSWPCQVILDEQERHPLVQLRAYTQVPPFLQKYVAEHGVQDMADDLFNLLSGGHHLVFANSRARTEQVASLLAARCRQLGMDNEFFPHHGSLSHALRADLEARLQDPARPATAVCTSTLELGIDIGDMDSVVQIDAPCAVANLIQRLGRAGRRGGQQLLRICLLEHYVLRSSGLADRLHLGLFQSLAVLRLLQQGWCEPAESDRPHYSTLVQQILAVLGQYQAVRPSVLWRLLCQTGPFAVTEQNFGTLLRGMAAHGLICRHEGEKDIRLGERGQQLVDAADFTTAFRTAEEFCLESEGRSIGRLPLIKPLEKGQCILFAGRAWKVTDLDQTARRICLVPDQEGKPPKFSGAGQSVHDRVRMMMQTLYEHGTVPGFVNQKGRALYQKARTAYLLAGLEKSRLVMDGSRLCLFPWRGDRFCSTVAALLRLADIEASDMAGIVDLGNVSTITFFRRLKELLAGGRPAPEDLTKWVPDSLQEKFAPYVDPHLRAEDNMARFYQLEEVWTWLEQLLARRR